MAKTDLLPDVLSELEERFGERMSADPVERYIYSRDMGEFPGIVGKIVGGLAQAIVQVENADELAWIAAFARRRGLPLTPRAAATSGYGGAIPVLGGIVVDLTRMNRVLAIDVEERSVTVEPGVIWWDLEKELRARGLALRTYPSSAPSSTVGGWVAEGGSGIGAYAYNEIADNLQELKIVAPDKEKTVRGDDMDLYVGSEGILGFISEVKLTVREAAAERPLLFSFGSPEGAQRFLNTLKGRDLPLFHLQVITPQLAALKNKVSEAAYLPEGSYLVLAVLESDETDTHEELVRLAASAMGKELEEEAAEHEWDERVYPLRIKKAGPSVIPAEAEVPLVKMGALLEETAKRLPELALEVVIGRQGKAVFLGFIPSDSRSADFTVSFTASLEFLSLAEKYGAPYGIGLYFVDKADKRMGRPERRNCSRRNEGGPRMPPQPGEARRYLRRYPAPEVPACHDGRAPDFRCPLPYPPANWPPICAVLRKKLPEKVEEAAFTCAQCGYCKEGCTLFDGRGWESASPRGKMQYLRGYAQGEVPLTEEMSDTFLLCTTCKKCDLACQTDLPIESIWEEMRG